MDSMNIITEETAKSLIPLDLSDISTIPVLAALYANDFGGLMVPLLLRSMNARPYGSRFNESAQDLIISRASEDMTITVIADALKLPIEDEGRYGIACTAMHQIIMKLPVEKLRAYGHALITLVKANVREGANPNITSLKLEAGDVHRFIDDPSLVWVPKHKFDFMAERSLNERLKTAEQIRPLVPELLGWLVDKNWPPYAICWAHLARFPEEAAAHILILLQSERGDGGWLLNMLEFIEECVPLGPLWEHMRSQVEALVAERKGDEDEWELSVVAHEWLKKLDAWKKEQA
ncbi:Fc.00g108320.m01.CDS01 [Cosmosporella sp. VM-42]